MRTDAEKIELVRGLFERANEAMTKAYDKQMEKIEMELLDPKYDQFGDLMEDYYHEPLDPDPDDPEYDLLDEPFEDDVCQSNDLAHRDEVTERLIATMEEYLSFATMRDLVKLMGDL